MLELKSEVLGTSCPACALPQGAKPTFKPGQWVDFHIPGVKEIGGFSITSSPQQLKHDKTLDLAIKRASYPPARWVHEQVGGPKNQLIMDENSFKSLAQVRSCVASSDFPNKPLDQLELESLPLAIGHLTAWRKICYNHVVDYMLLVQE